MRQAGKILGSCLQMLEQNTYPGVKLLDLDKKAHNFILLNGGMPAFLNYKGFPNTVCISVNHILIHGIPTDYVLKEGDIVSYDLGVKYENYYADAAITVGVGDTNDEDQKLIFVTKNALYNAIKCVKNKCNLNDLAKVIYQTITEAGYYTPLDYCGHGIGSNLHEDPMILNYPEDTSKVDLKTNMVIAIEPMVLQGSNKVEVLPDKWSVASALKMKSAHFEHTIVVHEDHGEILTKIN